MGRTRDKRELAALNTSAAKHQTGYFNVLLAAILGRMGQLREATRVAERGLTLLPSTPTSAQISGLTTLGTLFALQGQLDKSTNILKKGIQIARHLGHLNRLATLWMNMGINEKRRANFSLAIASYQKALQLYQRMGDVDAEGLTLVNLGMIYIILGEDKQAFYYLSTAIQSAKTHQLIESEAFAKTNFAFLQIVRGRLTSEVTTLKRAYDICIELELTYLLPAVLYWQAEVARLKGKHTQALTLIQESLEMATEGRYMTEEGIGWSIKGKILDAMRQFDEAEAAHKTSLQLLEQEPYDLAQSQLALAQHYVMREATLSDRSKSLLMEALATFEKLGAKRGIALTKVLLDIGKGPTRILARRRVIVEE